MPERVTIDTQAAALPEDLWVGNYRDVGSKVANLLTRQIAVMMQEGSVSLEIFENADAFAAGNTADMVAFYKDGPRLILAAVPETITQLIQEVCSQWSQNLPPGANELYPQQFSQEHFREWLLNASSKEV